MGRERAIITRAREKSAGLRGRGKGGRKTFRGIPHTERNRARLHFSAFRAPSYENAVSPPADRAHSSKSRTTGRFLCFSPGGSPPRAFRQSPAARPQKTLRPQRSRRSVPPATQKRQRSTDGVRGTKTQMFCEIWTMRMRAPSHRFHPPSPTSINHQRLRPVDYMPH